MADQNKRSLCIVRVVLVGNTVGEGRSAQNHNLPVRVLLKLFRKLCVFLGFYSLLPQAITDLNYWIKHPFEFSDPIVKPEYL